MRRRACDACYKRKVHCDHSESKVRCSWCSRHDLTCTFERPTARKQGKKPGYKSFEGKLSERLTQLEEALARALALQQKNFQMSRSTTNVSTPLIEGFEPIQSVSLPETSSSDDMPHASDIHISAPQDQAAPSTTFESLKGHLNFPGYILGPTNCFPGIPFFSKEGQQWILAHTGNTVSGEVLDKLATPGNVEPSRTAETSLYGSLLFLEDLPSQNTILYLVQVFERSEFRSIFPLIDVVLFMTTIQQAYASPGECSAPDHTSAQACILAFVSLGYLFGGSGIDSSTSIDYYGKAFNLLLGVFENTGIVNLQTMIMLHINQAFLGHFQPALLLHAMSCRTVVFLGGGNYAKIYPPHAVLPHEKRERQHLRMLFWICYYFDKDITLRTGQPPALVDESYDLTIPPFYVECHTLFQRHLGTEGAHSSANETMVPHFPGDLRLIILKGRVWSLLYSATAMKKSDTELLRAIREVDDELEAWRLSIPVHIRPGLSIHENVSDARYKSPFSMQRICLHLEYQYLLSAIHRSSGRCFPFHQPNCRSIPPNYNGLHSSLALTVEASRITLLYLSGVVDQIASEPFWIIVHYPIAAIMTLFYNALLNPQDPQCRVDVETIRSTICLIRQMAGQKLTPFEISQLKLIEAFTSELARLADCAIATQMEKA